MPNLTLWDKISQNLAHLEGNSDKELKSHRIFRPFYNRFCEEIKIKHCCGFHKLLIWKKKTQDYIGGAPKWCFKKISQIFVKSPLKFCLISQILVKSLWHVWMPINLAFNLMKHKIYNQTFIHTSDSQPWSHFIFLSGLITLLRSHYNIFQIINLHNTIRKTI